MSERRYTVWVKDPIKDLDFDEFYDKFLNIKEDGYDTFEELYGNKDWVDSIMRPIRQKVRRMFDTAIEEEEHQSSDFFYDRRFTLALVDYIATIGVPIRVRDISGGSPGLRILTGKSKITRLYLENPVLDIDKRFSYMLYWAKERGLTTRKVKE